ncbi:hypothetical protein R1flu_006911 [Riccia fluitans]|uniref:Uncharacterized protein n=1 Tax=Riccia fluitans TaxID=41844 RepID=A0ABD1YXC2_9MARC
MHKLIINSQIYNDLRDGQRGADNETKEEEKREREGTEQRAEDRRAPLHHNEGVRGAFVDFVIYVLQIRIEVLSWTFEEL